jgi:hypothetical protein
MTESALPLPEQATASPVPGEETEPDGKRRMLLLAGGVAVLLVLLVGVYFLFLKGGSSSNNGASGLVPSAHNASRPTGGVVKKAGAATRTLPSTFNNVLARDPFKPLYVPPPPKPSAAPTSGTTGTTTTTTTAMAGSSSTPVTLMKVYAQNGKHYAQTKVGNAVYTAAVGQTFGGTFQLLNIAGSSATYVQGDEQFSLSVGQVVLR